ncbi:hypothetical protein SAMN06265222_1244 [Neorhodopirellula lusitana]|uniref:Phosphatidylinositol-4,5-bisphosphate 4-phosphatase n=1 Tax=Neorhodopirellula lusitana TaxID=445327 RepID=A0ABY1QSN6_9BACT|nr:hypothetical protein SAMN06265222_1244 [Neorhodopirellula lusitana]
MNPFRSPAPLADSPLVLEDYGYDACPVCRSDLHARSILLKNKAVCPRCHAPAAFAFDHRRLLIFVGSFVIYCLGCSASYFIATRAGLGYWGVPCALTPMVLSYPFRWCTGRCYPEQLVRRGFTSSTGDLQLLALRRADNHPDQGERASDCVGR